LATFKSSYSVFPVALFSPKKKQTGKAFSRKSISSRVSIKGHLQNQVTLLSILLPLFAFYGKKHFPMD
jgi:hypothetical protein